ncbi:MAG: hypothetical protein AAFY60_21690, partial [Myxococcota bacterium]
IAAISAFIDGSVAVAEQAGHRIRLIEGDRNRVQTVLGSGLQLAPSDSTGPNVMDSPRGVTFAPNGDVIFADSGNQLVRRVASNGVPVLALTPTDGRGAVVIEDRLYVADLADGHVEVLDLATDSPPSIVGGFTAPTDLAAGAGGTVLVVDNNALFEIDPSNADAVRRVAGGGGSGYSEDGTTADGASFDGLESVAVALDGTIYLGERGIGHIRTIDGTGALQTVFGGDLRPIVPGLSADALVFAELGDFSVNGADTVFVADAGDERVFAVDADGTTRHIAGRGPTRSTAPSGTDGAPATTVDITPLGLGVSTTGGVLIVDGRTNSIKTVESDGTLSTLALPA